MEALTSRLSFTSRILVVQRIWIIVRGGRLCVYNVFLDISYFMHKNRQSSYGIIEVP